MSDSRRLRWGLLSTARINRAVIPIIRSSRKSELVAVASRSEEKVSAYAAKWGIPRFYSIYEDLLADSEIDVIYISLPNALHAEWSIKALQMGKHVLCEKPLTTSTQDADAVINTAKKTGKIITEAFMYRHHPQTLLVKQMVDNGEVGSLQLIRGSFCYYNTHQGDTRFDPAMGGGSLWDIGCYPIGYSRYLTGKEPLEVYGHQATGPTGIDLSYAGQMLFPDGVISQFDCSFITIRKAEMEIIGEKGRIVIPEPYKPGKLTKVHFQQDEKERVININGTELYQGEIEDIEDAILLNKPIRIGLEDSRANIATIEALYESAKKSTQITIQNN